jgi:hypothetical protein
MFSILAVLVYFWFLADHFYEMICLCCHLVCMCVCMYVQCVSCGQTVRRWNRIFWILVYLYTWHEVLQSEFRQRSHNCQFTDEVGLRKVIRASKPLIKCPQEDFVTWPTNLRSFDHHINPRSFSSSTVFGTILSCLVIDWRCEALGNA